MKEIGKKCKQFRKEVLRISLTEFSKLNNANIKNVCAFESGKANNINYLFMYYNVCSNDYDKQLFLDNVFKD